MPEASGSAALQRPAEASPETTGPTLHAVPDGPKTVKRRLTPKRPAEVVENPEFAAFACRILRAAARRVGDGNVAGLGGLVVLRSELDTAIAEAVQGLRSPAWGYSWADIARVLGTTRQAAQQRYGATGA